MAHPSTLRPSGRFRRLPSLSESGRSLLQALIFGLLVLALLEWLCRSLGISPIVLPAPSSVLERLWAQWPMLAADARQTILYAALPGALLGTLLGVLVAAACDSSSFLRHGLLPVGRFISALPVVGIAPVFVMWFGFDWQSKLAVAATMTFFPALVNALEGLGSLERDARELMRTYAANRWQIFIHAKAFHALPFLFNALKINWSLAMIGAIVAEFFGTPTVGIGFRIAVAIGQLDMSLVWAEIVVASAAAIAGYALIAWLERRFTPWHASSRAN